MGFGSAPSILTAMLTSYLQISLTNHWNHIISRLNFDYSGTNSVCWPSTCWASPLGRTTRTFLIHCQSLHLLAGLCDSDKDNKSSSSAASCSVNSWLYPGLPFGDPAWLEQVHLAACQLLGISRALVAGGEIWFLSRSTSTFYFFLPCILCIAQVSFANLERVEVLGLPGSEGELRVRGDKTVTTTSDANLFVAWLEISLIGFMQNG